MCNDTALYKAISKGDDRTVELLLKGGAKIDLVDKVSFKLLYLGS